MTPDSTASTSADITAPPPFSSTDAPQDPAVTTSTDTRAADLEALDAEITSKKAELAAINEEITTAEAELADVEAQLAAAGPVAPMPSVGGESSGQGVDLVPTAVAETPAVEPIPAVEHPDGKKRYVTAEGDTLDDIADREHVNRDDLYTLNRPAIEAAAQGRGFSNSNDGQLLFLGVTLELP